MREKVGLKVVKALKRNDIGVSHAAIDMLCALMQVKTIHFFGIFVVCICRVSVRVYSCFRMFS